jgi:hypothetical protein
MPVHCLFISLLLRVNLLLPWQVKLEKEKNRIEKERLRAMERQAKLERMKGRLSAPDGAFGETPSSPPPLGRATTPMAQDALAQHKVTFT